MNPRDSAVDFHARHVRRRGALALAGLLVVGVALGVVSSRWPTACEQVASHLCDPAWAPDCSDLERRMREAPDDGRCGRVIRQLQFIDRDQQAIDRRCYARRAIDKILGPDSSRAYHARLDAHLGRRYSMPSSCWVDSQPVAVQWHRAGETHAELSSWTTAYEALLGCIHPEYERDVAGALHLDLEPVWNPRSRTTDPDPAASLRRLEAAEASIDACARDPRIREFYESYRTLLGRAVREGGEVVIRNGRPVSSLDG